ncbi:MAG: aminoacyl-tRNA hydrolase [Clostridia bacterium]|nr:aminoacyl-tRNA hydrolase [Clostridia bacterium]
MFGKKNTVKSSTNKVSDNRYLIVGLGNPGSQYAKTRHNVGFMVIDCLLSKLNASLKLKKFNGMYTKVDYNGKELYLLEPLTYMNLSGESIRDLAGYFKIPAGNIIVIYDDMDLELGRLRMRMKGSAGSHNGMKSIISCINTQEFPRIRVGIGCHGIIEAKDYVLGKFTAQDMEILTPALEKAADAALEILDSGVEKAMNKYNESRK